MTGIFFYLTNGEITVATFLGTHVLIAIYSMIRNLRHSHVWLDYGVLGYLFISPAQQQISQSLSAHHLGKNCGFELAVWDGLFGTLYVPKQKEDFAWVWAMERMARGIRKALCISDRLCWRFGLSNLKNSGLNNKSFWPSGFGKGAVGGFAV